MDKIDINIDISGPTNSGKSHITYLIMQMLEEKGFDCNLTDNDFVDTEDFKNKMSKDLDKIINVITNKTSIKITNTYIKRNNI